jgi:hypothetical protein
MKIAIKFGDNDFGNTFRDVLQMLLEASKWNRLTNDKAKLLFLINQLSPIAYITHQNQWEYNGLEKSNGTDTLKNEEFLHSKKYLQITSKQLLIDGEVDAYLKKLGKDQWDNGETFILNTDSEEIYSV